MLNRGQLAIEPMITHRVPWHELPDIYRRLDQGDLSILGVVVDLDGSVALSFPKHL